MSTNLPIYLDYNATTPVAPEVADAMLPFLRERFGNPSSSHPAGRLAARAVGEARDEVAALIGARSGEIVFTGCATEANNLALLGVAQALGDTRRHLVVSAVEHPAVMAPARWLEANGWSLTVLPVDGHGRVSPDNVARALRPDTALVSVMHANNEVGTIQPVAEIAAVTRSRGILLHTDAAQSAGKVEVNVDRLGADLLTLAGHKFYATKGVGALYVRTGTPIRPVLFGADQEHGLRPGTENVPAIVGLGAAARLARERLPEAGGRLRGLRDRLHEALARSVPGLVLNGHPDERLPNTLHLSFPGVTGRALLEAAAEVVAASVGSACHSEHDAVSGVLAAMSVDAARARGAVRLSVGMMTTGDEVDRAAAGLIAAWRGLTAR
ncbi:cysteine desulfurase family protein [Aromatoleum evansii]|uniref:cysteine desulfurase family protein n=1 Tax=Aromatoleum evansii TaxID=59406 RepID=UPI00145C9354|nr:cysteine desulfurase family protein [Aromatoleum evansii]NMG32641.1 aminotransferase class V-fold PLP-dependent enzyme [Aromatoleum evansii]